MRDRHPTRRALGAGCGGLLLFGAASSAQAGWLFVLAAGLLGLVGASLLFPHRLAALRIERVVPARASVGARVPLRYTVRNEGHRAVVPLRLEDTLAAVGPVRVACDRLEPGEVASVELEAVAQRRGAYEEGDVTLLSGWPFGLVRSRRVVSVPSALVVAPRSVELRALPALAPSPFVSGATGRPARVGAGSDYLGVREYRPGDPARAVHWRTAARRDELVVRERQDEAPVRLAIVLVARDDGAPPESSFEALVAAAASVALHALACGHRVDLLRPAEGGAQETLHDADRSGALEWLARAQPVDVGFGLLPARAAQRAGRGGTVALLTSTSSRAAPELAAAVRSVQAAGARPLVVTARSETWDGISAGRQGLTRIAGVEMRSISRGEDLRACLEV